MLEFDKSQRFTNFVRFLETQGVVKLNGGVPTILKPEILNAIGLAFFVYYIARGMSASRRVTFVPVSAAQTALLVEPLPADDGIFLRGKKDGDYVAVPIAPTMRPTTGLCPGKAFVHANWATYMDKELPDLPDCADCSGDDNCATGKWIALYLHDHPEDSLGLVGGHALLVDAPPAVFELVGTEPVVAEDDAEAKMAGAKDLDMKYFDAYLTLDLAVIAGAKVYIPNTQLAKPVASPYECDVVVYDKGKEYLAIVETAMGVGPEEEALLEEKAELGTATQLIPPLALRIRKKHSSHMGLAALGVSNYRYVYASVGKLDFGQDGKEHAAYAAHLMKATPPMKTIELEVLEPEVLRLREPKWWKPQLLTEGFEKFRNAIRDGVAL